ncbi:MAG: L-histidine N(alpha)-methyltransferase [Rhodocyclaceae bacterium]|nr:L-histidine N(alpha)-methyltransferase [Rhodocyclaceae bacterium]
MSLAPFRFADLRQASDGRAELLAGLLADRAFIPPKYFYDELGSRLFAAICCLPEYALTRQRGRHLRRARQRHRPRGGAGRMIVDLGAGDCGKAARLFPRLDPAGYVALDISADYLRGALERLKRRFPALPMAGAAVDFTRSLDLPDSCSHRPGRRGCGSFRVPPSATSILTMHAPSSRASPAPAARLLPAAPC